MKKSKICLLNVLLLFLLFVKNLSANPQPNPPAIEATQSGCDVILEMWFYGEDYMAPCTDKALIYRIECEGSRSECEPGEDNVEIIAELSCDDPFLSGERKIVDRNVPEGSYYYQLFNSEGEAMDLGSLLITVTHEGYVCVDEGGCNITISKESLFHPSNLLNLILSFLLR